MAKLRHAARRCLGSARAQHRSYSAPTDGAIPPAKRKYVPNGGTYPKGFVAGSAHAGVKPSNTKFDDLALIASKNLCSAAGLFTVNAFKAAPVTVSKQILENLGGSSVRGVVINSGCANAVTGTGGVQDAIRMGRMADDWFPRESSTTSSSILSGADPQTKTLVMSTGVIGQRLPIDRITSRIPDLYASLGETHDHWLGAAKAICTTDTFPKLMSRTFTLPSHPQTQYSLAGMTKGAGMIHPNMATLLSIICTDVAISPPALQSLLKSATDKSFNSISIDGDTSTNDTVNIFANGAAAPPDLDPLELATDSSSTPLPLTSQSEDYQAFSAVLSSFMSDLAQLIVRDGEGATKFVTIRVSGALTNLAAKQVAESISKSPLVKTALYGKDANWGRILCATGYSAARETVCPEFTSVSFKPADGSAELKLLTQGEPESVDEERAKVILEMEDLEILVKLDDGADAEAMAEWARGLEETTGVKLDSKEEAGKGEALVWTCDFSHEYVTINGDYRT